MTTSPWYTIGGEATFDAIFADNKTKPGLNVPVSFNLLYKEKYTNYDVEVNGKEISGPFDGIHFYHNHMESALTALHEKEKEQGSATHEDNVHSINPVTGYDYYGSPYYTIQMASVEDYTDSTHVVLGADNRLELYGGGDGTMDDIAFDLEVRNKLRNFGKDGIELYDYARYPYTTIWDSGFSIDTKFELFPITAMRPDMVVFAATQDVTKKINDIDTEIATAIALNARAAIQVESPIYSTSFARGVICPWAGTPKNGDWRKLSTLNRDLADKVSRWMGSSTGKWVVGNDMDVDSGKNITSMTVDNYSYKPLPIREKMWLNQMVAVEYSNMNQLIFSGYQTMHDNDSSVLNTIPTIMACTAATRACMYNFKRLVGNSKYTANQMIKESVNNIGERMKGIGDGRFVFKPWATVEGVDADVGYAWSSGCSIYANNGWTVNTITIDTHTMAELDSEA